MTGRKRSAALRIAPATNGCGVDGCTRPYWARGLCNTHYSRWRKHGSTLSYAAIANGRGQRIRPKKTCTVEGCKRTQASLGYCNLHYQRVRNLGYPGISQSMHERMPRTSDELWRQAKESGLHMHAMRTHGNAPPRWTVILPDRNGRDNLCQFDTNRCMRIAPMRLNEAPVRIRRAG